jgi:DNA polymerase III subunit beta
MKALTLLKQLEFIAPAIERDPVVPILEYALVESGQLIGSNLRTTLLYKTDIEGTFLFPFKSVQKVASMLPKDADCELSFDGQAMRVTLKTSSGKFVFNDIPELGDYPKLPTRQEVEIGILNSLDLNRISAAIPFTANDELRPSMSAVYIGNQIAATDGHRLAWFEYSGIVKEGSILIDKKTAGVLSNLGSATIRWDGGGYAEFHNNKGQGIIARLIEERYPDYKLVIPNESTTRVTVAKEPLLTAMNLGIQMANKTTRQILFDFKSASGLTVTAKDLDFDTKFEYDIPCVVEGNDIRIAFDGAFVKSILQSIDSEELTLKLTKPNKCGVVNDSFLLMPLMITEYA